MTKGRKRAGEFSKRQVCPYLVSLSRVPGSTGVGPLCSPLSYAYEDPLPSNVEI